VSEDRDAQGLAGLGHRHYVVEMGVGQYDRRHVEALSRRCHRLGIGARVDQQRLGVADGVQDPAVRVQRADVLVIHGNLDRLHRGP
jgi:hypothetical protein